MPTGEHDGGLLYTIKGRAIGTQEDRASLDTLLDRVIPDEACRPDLQAHQSSDNRSMGRQAIVLSRHAHTASL